MQVNAALEALHQTQRGWVVPDGALKAGLKDRIYSHFLPAYSVRAAPPSRLSVRVCRPSTCGIQLQCWLEGRSSPR